MKSVDLREAEAILGRVCRNELGLVCSDHFWERARQRFHGFSFLPLLLVLRAGKIVGGPVRDADNRNFRVTVEARIPDFGRVRVVVGIARNRDAVCITLFR